MMTVQEALRKLTELQEKLDVADTLIIISECGSVARMEYKHWLTAVPNALCNYASSCGKTSIVISADKPYDVQLYPAANAILATYGCRGSSVDPTTVIIGEVTGEKNAYGPNILAAVEVILESGQASVSMLQRRLKLGYSRAARLVDQMEERGIVGPFEGSKPRAVLITKSDWQERMARKRDL